jgi:Putative MetA-pathway of phenol degradation
MNYIKICFAAACILRLCSPLSVALAGSVTQPGSTVGTAPGAPLPEGFYFSNTADWGVRDPSTRLFVDHPVYTWSTPWMILGARFQVLAETAFDANERGGRHAGGFYNPLLTGQLAWDLGNGFGFSYTFGAYFDVRQELAWSSTSINQRFALSYTGGGWNLTANVIYGIHLDAVTDRPQISPCPAPFGLNGCNPNFVNIDLTATKKFDKWELGPVAFGSMDLSRPIASYEKQSQLAVGWLVGYDFGPVRLQAYVTRDVYEHNYSGHDTRVWGRVTVPLWTAAASTPPAVVRRY